MGIYLLLFALMALSPLQIMTNAAPSITRKRALSASKNPKSFATIVTRRFWILYPLTTCLTAGSMIFLMERWSMNSAIINAGVSMLLLLSIAFTGYMISIPAYVIVKSWKR